MYIDLRKSDKHDQRIINAINIIKDFEGIKTTKECIKMLVLDKVKKIKRKGF